MPLLVIERDFPSLLDDLDTPLPDTPIHEDDPFILIFTSGTTGRPKAAVLSHRCVIGFVTLQSMIAVRAMAMAGRAPSGAAPAPRLTPFPLFHVSGMGTVVSTVLTGGTTVWPTGKFDPPKIIELTRTEGVGSWGGASTHIMRLLECPDIETLDPLQITQVGIGGSATTPELVRRTEARFPHLKGTFSSGYGSTETGGLVTYAPNWMLQAATDCVGPAMPSVDIRITDDFGEVVPDGEEGNIEARSAICMLGYWRNDAANDDTIQPGRWIRTGDFGHIENGLLFIASRRRDLIIRGGENIYPFEIENRLDEHPDIDEAAVFGVDDVVFGQDVKAVVVLRAGASLTEDAVRAWCGEALASYKVPTHVEIRTEPLPRNATGKVMKHVLAGEGENTFVED
jgi:acyl-CoA synthetase (AMP-forming)/AMP-acid ligase II